MDLIENSASSYFSIVACVFVAAVTFVSSRWSVIIMGYTYRHTDRWEGFMKSAVEMGLGAITYIPRFMKIGSAIQKLIWEGGYTDT
jgi:hypothetical protein